MEADDFVKMDYARLSSQEQAIMDRRPEVWSKFFAVIAIPGGYAGIVGLKGAIFLLALIPFFLTCLALDMCHDEQVLRYDVRRSMKRIAKAQQVENHESQYQNQDGSRWWAGYYKRGRLAAFLVAECIVSVLLCWYFGTTGVWWLSVLLTAFNAGFILATIRLLW